MNKEEVFKKMIDGADSTQKRLFLSAVYLFSAKGYNAVGIRELCRSVGVKESSFYNHYRSKEELLERIFAYFAENSQEIVMGDAEIEEMAAGGIRAFLEANMGKLIAVTEDNILYHTILQIVLMESYINPQAYELAKNNLYFLRRDYTEKVLQRMVERGSIKPCDVSLVTAEHYYALKGLLDDFLLREVWGGDLEEIGMWIQRHSGFFADMLKI